MRQPIYEGIIPVPDSGFMRKLKRISPKLDCVFSRERGKFVIKQKSDISGWCEVFQVEGDEGGGFRYPDNRDIISLHEADRYVKSRRQRMRESKEYMEKYREDHEKQAADEFRDATKDNKIQLMRAYVKSHNLGKFESPYRKVGVTPKGNTEQHDGFTVIDRTLRAST